MRYVHFVGDAVNNNRDLPSDVIVEGCVTTSVVARGPDDQHGFGLTEMQDRFIDEFIRCNGRLEEAALAAGYSQGGARNIGCRLLARPKVQAEITRRLKLQTGSALAIAIGALFRIIEESEDHRAVVQAALGIMDRMGMAPPRGPSVAVQVNNIGGTEAQSILTAVQAARQQRLAQRDAS